MNLDKVTLIHQEFDKVMAAFAARHNMKFEPASFRYGAQGIKTSVKFSPIVSVASAAGVSALSRKELDNLRIAGLSTDAVGSEFDFNGSAWIFKAYKPNRRKYPVVAEKVSDGKQYKLPRYAIEAFKRKFPYRGPGAGLMAA